MTPDLLKCAQLCAASYNDADPRFVTVDELRFGVIPDGDTVYVVNRGTANIEGWMDDLKAFPLRKDEDGSMVHHGFFDCVEKVYPKIKEELSWLPPICRIVLTGHSLGAAISALMAKRLKCPVVTFGEPRQQSQFGKDALPTEHYRIVNEGDPIIHVPDKEFWVHTVKPFRDLMQDGDSYGPAMHSIDLYISRL